MARRYPQALFCGLDASEEMLKTARRKIARAGLASRIALHHGYAEGLTLSDFERTTASDRVVSSCSLSMIPDWLQALRASERVLATGGRLHITDFGDLCGSGPIARGLMRDWLHLFHVEPRTEILAALDAADWKNFRRHKYLYLLPGRYVFVLNCPKGVFAALIHDCCSRDTAARIPEG
jgi:S-adenosylmethionine-diacylgycerolhomoserine-N-methlytransferase